MLSFPRDLDELKTWFEDHGESGLPGHMGMEIVELTRGRCSMRLTLDLKHRASNGFLHAGTVVALADTAAGYGCVASLPDEASGFTTVELKSNHTSSLDQGGLIATATMQHGGRTIQVWDAEVTAEGSGKRIALFRNTQLILYR